MRALYSLTIFASSALLFLVQPMVARMVLPTFGGAPAVWNASMVFFQFTLLLGYLYAHLTTRHLGARRQAGLHLVLLAAVFLFLPFGTHTDLFQWVQAESKGGPGQAFLVMIGLMGVVGIPFFVVSAGAPLVQRWFADTTDPAAKDPYFLYSASNAGSMLGLFAYPILMEPTLRLGEQSRAWAAIYGGMAILMGLCAVALWISRVPEGSKSETVQAAEPAVAPSRRVAWVLLGAIPSSLMLGLTTYLTTNIAPVPMLWVVPLALYLLSFILAFARFGPASAPILGRIFPLAAIPLALALILEATEPLAVLAVLHLAVFFVAAWMCHARLSSLRPGPGRLTEFYLWLSVGGVVGGIFNSLAAPVMFPGFYEYPLALVLACLLRPRKEGEESNSLDWAYPILVGSITFTAIMAARYFQMETGVWRTLVTVGIPVVAAFFAVDRPIRFGLALGAVLTVSFVTALDRHGTTLLRERTFFGLHTVTLVGDFVRFVHGNTLHGVQDRRNPDRPLTYYHRTGPIGTVFRAFAGPFAKPKVALVGLGTGSLAAYGEPGQQMTFYEIDPLVEEIARDPSLFTFLRDSRANIRVVLGDARLTLERAPGGYGLIVLDAFSSDAIPVHLLTLEAIQMYLERLAPDGILAFHISNRYLLLEGVLAETGRAAGLVNMLFQDSTTVEEELEGKTASHWMIFARKKEDFGPLNRNFNWSEFEPEPGTRPWTDDHSNVLGTFDRSRIFEQ